MLAVWQAADDIEVFESGWTFDHFYPIFSDSAGPCLEGWITLTALAQATKRLARRRPRHGHPLPASRRAGQYGRRARHRLQRPPRARDRRGLERGGVGRLRHRTRHPSRSASTGSRKPARCITSLLTQETTTFDGKYYQLKDARNEPKGPQQPHPPICIGGSGEKRTLSITAKYAQHWNFAGGTPEEFARKRDVLAAHCADIGRDPKEIMLSSHVRLGEDGDVKYAQGRGRGRGTGRGGTRPRHYLPAQA